MLKRTITGFFILLLVAGFTALRLVSPYFFDAFVLLLIYLALTEISLSRSLHKNPAVFIAVYTYPVLLAIIYLLFSSFGVILLLQLAAIILEFVALMTIELIQNSIKRRRGQTAEGDELNKSLLSNVKLALELIVYPTTLLGFLFGINHMGLNIGFVALIMVFAVAMMTDVFAYLFGMMIKGPKFAPEISPKKTISGSFFGALGGLISAALGYVLFVHLGLLGNSFSHISSAVSIIVFVLIGLVGTYMTQFGDLVESAYKRKLGVKDFGNILPGHGGVMDRVDGLMFVAALVYVVFTLLVV